MDSPDFSSGKSPRRELQGPRPAPLKVRKDSHKIKKPPLAPQQQYNSYAQPQQIRPPVIIYTVSPKVIHANPSEFMTLVQRLTGPSSSSSSSSSYPFQDHGGGLVSPAARLASIEKTKTPEKKNTGNFVGTVGGVEIGGELERDTGFNFPGILSPNPAALQPIPANLFAPPADPSPFSFFNDLSPVLQGNKNFMEGNFMLSPNFLSPQVISPTPSLDLFNNFFDL